jgi:predicted nucleic acid-binding protein
MVSPSLAGQRVYIDASALIYAIEVPQQYPGLRAKVFTPFALGQLTLVTSWITFAEVLIRPLQVRDAALESTYRQFFMPSTAFEILRVDQGISDQAASLRAMYGLKLPDAIHIATGLAAGCSHYLTGDAKWTQTGLQVIQAANL